MQTEKKYRRDILLVAGLLAAGAVFALILFLGGKSGSIVQVRVDGTVVKELPLAEDATWEIHGVDGGTNQLVIRSGEAWVEEASCPDGLCVGMGKISRSGQSVVCLPNTIRSNGPFRRIAWERVYEVASTSAPERARSLISTP